MPYTLKPSTHMPLWASTDQPLTQSAPNLQARATAPSLLSLPPEMAAAVLKRLGPRDLARVERACRAFRGPPSLVELALRERAAERGATVPAALPQGEVSWTQLLAWWDRRDTQQPRQRFPPVEPR